jgi:hypothetical protein
LFPAIKSLSVREISNNYPRLTIIPSAFVFPFLRGNVPKVQCIAFPRGDYFADPFFLCCTPLSHDFSSHVPSLSSVFLRVYVPSSITNLSQGKTCIAKRHNARCLYRETHVRSLELSSETQARLPRFLFQRNSRRCLSSCANRICLLSMLGAVKEVRSGLKATVYRRTRQRVAPILKIIQVAAGSDRWSRWRSIRDPSISIATTEEFWR